MKLQLLKLSFLCIFVPHLFSSQALALKQVAVGGGVDLTVGAGADVTFGDTLDEEGMEFDPSLVPAYVQSAIGKSSDDQTQLNTNQVFNCEESTEPFEVFKY